MADRPLVKRRRRASRKASIPSQNISESCEACFPNRIFRSRERQGPDMRLGMTHVHNREGKEYLLRSVGRLESGQPSAFTTRPMFFFRKAKIEDTICIRQRVKVEGVAREVNCACAMCVLAVVRRFMKVCSERDRQEILL